MRIISGNFRGKKISLPKDKETRPLRDLVKESIFNLINHSNKFSCKIHNSEILDAEMGVWSWTDDSQTKITVGQPGEDQATTGTLVSVTESQLIFTFDEMDYDYDTGQIIQYQTTYTFTK